jgi:ADP-ribose pyrophosphatase YjhB (NUDIX family)
VNKHFTASAVVLHRESVLLVYHPRLNAWVPPGGHIEPGELPDEAAVREVLEETNVAVEVISEDVPDTGSEEVFVLKQPLCMHQVKAFENGEHVYHIDIVYLCRPKLEQELDQGNAADGDMPQVTPGDGITQSKWVKIEELSSMELAPNVIEVVALGYSKLECKNAALRP